MSFSDPSFLESLAVAKAFFDLSGRVSPGSIRDQIVRASLFVEAAVSSGDIRAGSRVLIIGAGAAGVTVAFRLVGISGIEVTLADAQPRILSVQAECAHRIISPSLYDWPAAHYDRLRFTGSLLPAYEEGPPNTKFALAWREAFAKVSGNLRRRTARAEIQTANGPPWKAVFREESGESSAEFDLVVACRGFGRELTLPSCDEAGNDLGPFPIYGFWEADPYPEPDCGPVAVLGGGDGAIQDALRFLTPGESCRSLMSKLQPYLAASHPVAERLESLRGKEEQFRFQPGSSNTGSDLVDEYEQLVELFYSAQVGSVLDKVLQFRDVSLFYQKPHLGPCFGPNRFLALLFDMHFRVSGGRLLHPGYCAQRVIRDAAGRPCSVQLERSGATETLPFHVVIPRLGLDPATQKGPFGRGHKLHQGLPWQLSDWGPAPPALQ